MKRLTLGFLALATALAITPSAMADTWQYTIDGSNFSSDLILTTNSNGPVQYVTSIQGTFDISGVSSGITGTGETIPYNAHPASIIRGKH